MNQYCNFDVLLDLESLESLKKKYVERQETLTCAWSWLLQFWGQIEPKNMEIVTTEFSENI